MKVTPKCCQHFYSNSFQYNSRFSILNRNIFFLSELSVFKWHVGFREQTGLNPFGTFYKWLANSLAFCFAWLVSRWIEETIFKLVKDVSVNLFSVNWFGLFSSNEVPYMQFYFSKIVKTTILFSLLIQSS